MLGNTLFQRQLDKTAELRATTGPQTAFGQRLVELSKAFDHGLFPDHVIATYLDELVESCESQLQSLQVIRSVGGHSKTANFLNGLLELTDYFEEIESYDMEDAVRRLETELNLSAPILCGVAA